MGTKYEEVQEQLRGNPKKWCVTGAAGFIGSHLVEKLLSLNQVVIGIDNYSTGFQRNIAAFSSSSFKFLELDIQNIKSSQLEGVDYVLHQAALGSVPRSLVDPIKSHESNVSGFIQMLLAAREAQVRQFVYASSSSVYGDAAQLPMVEERLGQLLSPYAATKRIGEIYAQTFSKCYELNSVGLRYFNVFGPRQDPRGDYSAVIPRWIQAILDKQTCQIYGDGETSRDFSYIDNIVQANLLAALSGLSSGVFNIACGDKLSLTELYNLIAEEMLGAQFIKPIYKEFRSGDIRHSFADISLARAKLGYQPTIQAREGIKMTISAFLG